MPPPMKFYFRAQDISLQLPGMDVSGKLVLTWKRGPRRTTTQPFPIKEKLNNVDGTLSRSAATSQDLALICTMFKNSKTGAFESKVSLSRAMLVSCVFDPQVCRACYAKDGPTSEQLWMAVASPLMCFSFMPIDRQCFLQSATFSLAEEAEDGSMRKLGSEAVDLSSFATPDISSSPVELSLCEGKIILKFSLSSHWLKHSESP
ncbi:MAG: hypothetical protein SGPRY_006887 [Prymnesium sp.]